MNLRVLSPWLLIGIGLPAGFLALMLLSYPQIWWFWRFSARNQQYYGMVADACDQVLAKAGTTTWEIKGEALRSLPPVLREMNPHHVYVRTNLVMVRVGGGVTSYFVSWGSEDTPIWQLSLTAGETRTSKVLFSRRKPEAANPAGAVDRAERVRRYIEHPGRAATDPPR